MANWQLFDVTVAVHGAARLVIKAQSEDHAWKRAARLEGKDFTDYDGLFLVGTEAVDVENAGHAQEEM